MKKILLPLLLSLAIAATASASQRTMHEEGDRFNFNYPAFSQYTDKASYLMNKDINALVESSRKELKNPDVANVRTDYEIYFENPKFVSFTFGNGIYMTGAAHGMSYTHGFIYDKESGKKVPYTHFTDKLNAKEFKNGILNGKYTAYCSDLETISKTPFLADYKNFKVSKDYIMTRDGKAIYFIYQPYELDAYAAGPIFVKVAILG